jgi:hypothetical protein
MTDRLYYTDAYLQEFDARVVRVDARDGRTSVVLDRTAFYPTSGGQPFDTGLLDGRLRVIDVVDDENGDVVHVVDVRAGTLAAGQTVHGAIEWTRRFDHIRTFLCSASFRFRRGSGNSRVGLQVRFGRPGLRSRVRQPRLPPAIAWCESPA